MKRFACEFFRRGLMACGFGPILLIALYLILQRTVGVETLTVGQVCMGILSVSALAMIAGGLNALYQIERLPLMVAILIHGGLLYLSYLGTYLINGWLEWGMAPVLTFSAIFVIGYLVIWAIVYVTVRRKTEKLNEILREKQHSAETR